MRKCGMSRRYAAEHGWFRRFVASQPADLLMAAFREKNSDFFIPVWFSAGFRFTPSLFYDQVDGVEIGILTFPAPQEPGEAYLGAVVRTKDAPKAQYFLLEMSEKLFESSTGTMVCAWNDECHWNYGHGKAFSGKLSLDVEAFKKRVLEVGQTGGR
jgi:hypothetical protein